MSLALIRDHCSRWLGGSWARMSSTHDSTQSAGRIDGLTQPDVTYNTGEREMTRRKSQKEHSWVGRVSYSWTSLILLRSYFILEIWGIQESDSTVSPNVWEEACCVSYKPWSRQEKIKKNCLPFIFSKSQQRVATLGIKSYNTAALCLEAGSVLLVLTLSSGGSQPNTCLSSRWAVYPRNNM